MALSGLDIYKLLPKTNCKECGFATCLAFAMQIAKKAASLDKCPHLTDDAKVKLEESSQPPVKLVSIGAGENKLEVGNETVLFRHEEKFHHPCGIGFIIESDQAEPAIKEKLNKINQLKFERVGQEISVNLVAVRQKGSAEGLIKALKIVVENTQLGLMLMVDDPEALKSCLEITRERKPLIYRATKENASSFSKLAAEFKSALVVSAEEIEGLSALTKEANNQGVQELILDTASKGVAQKIWDFTRIRRQALKKSDRSLGYPVLAVIEKDDPFEEAMEVATFICKYAGIVLMKSIESWQALSLLTLRQNIYTDPQKPLQIEPKLYEVGQVSAGSPLLVTTNFSLTYYTVLGEVEASKVPSYILSVDTEGMSVLTAWAAEKFTPESITKAITKFGVKDKISHKNMIIPGYVAVLSGDLEESSGLKVSVGPKEAAGIPSFLKNL
ncbi:acetyl-CoA decarbonylase/synthase complex subunit gamma [Candidatus Omnitrophota bacterium]